MSKYNSVKELTEAQAPLLKEAAELNIKNNFSKGPWSEKDKARSKYLWDQMSKMDAIFYELHPHKICEECGGKRLARFDYKCFNFGDCKTAGYPGG